MGSVTVLAVCTLYMETTVGGAQFCGGQFMTIATQLVLYRSQEGRERTLVSIMAHSAFAPDNRLMRLTTLKFLLNVWVATKAEALSWLRCQR